MPLLPATVETLGGAAPLGDVQPTVGLLIPLIAAALGYRAVIGERESGTIRILAGTRLSRAEIVLGKIVGQSLTTLLFVIPGVCLVTIVDVIRYGDLALVTALGFLVLLLLYVLAITTIVVSLSTLASSSVQAAVLVFITAIAGLLLWSDVVVAIVWNLLTGTVPGNELRYSNAFEFVTRLSPYDAYYVLSNWLLDAPIGTNSAASQIAEAARRATAGTGSVQPIYLAPWFSFVPLIGWPIGLLSVAIWRFDHESLAVHQSSQFGWLSRLRIPWNRLSSRIPFTERFRSDGFLDWLPGMWQSVARREFRTLSRSLGIWVLGLLVLTSGLAGLSVPALLRNELGPLVPLAALQTPGITLLAGSGTLFFTFRAIFAERRSGSIRLTTGTEPSRTDVIVGVLIGRTTAVVVPVVMAILLTCVVAVPQYGVVPLGTLFGFVVATVGFLVTVAAVGIAISTLGRRQVVVGGATLLFVALPFFWESIINGAYAVITGRAVDPLDPPQNTVYFLFEWLLPSNLFRVLTNAVLGVPNSSGPALAVLSDVLQPLVVSNITAVRSVFGTAVPIWYLHPAVGAVGFVFWGSISLLLTTVVFGRSDLD